MAEPEVGHEYLWYYAEFCKENKIVEIGRGGFCFPDGVVIPHNTLIHAITDSTHDDFRLGVDEIPS